ncbi:MAG: FHA domain-containing protein [Solirubrobacteraceae bacterium]
MVGSSDAPGGPRPVTARELKTIIDTEREGLPFLVYRDADGQQRLLRLLPDRRDLAVGRNPAADLCIDWDAEVSGLHARLQQLAGEYAILDDGLSRNGSYVNGDRVRGTRRLRDGDMLRFGHAVVLFRYPQGAARNVTMAAQDALTAADLSDQQRKVLIALCRPFKDGAAFATPPTNQEIADHLFLSVDAVKLHLRALFDKFDVVELPQNKKRLALVERALQSGLLSDQDLH